MILSHPPSADWATGAFHSPLFGCQLAGQGSNLDSPRSERGMLPITPPANSYAIRYLVFIHRASEENRTPTHGLEDRDSALKLHSQIVILTNRTVAWDDEAPGEIRTRDLHPTMVLRWPGCATRASDTNHLSPSAR
jgi:hypothetical protein